MGNSSHHILAWLATELSTDELSTERRLEGRYAGYFASPMTYDLGREVSKTNNKTERK